MSVNQSTTGDQIFKDFSQFDLKTIEQEHVGLLQQYLTLTIPNVLEWKCPETQMDDWDNVPHTSA